jgi:glutamate/tyrosine decarboxylase-like PLP-dependent enzyme
MDEKEYPISAWFTGPKSENGQLITTTIRSILEDYLYWRRNYFPEDGVVVSSEQRRQHDRWNDLFNDRLMELLAALKADFPFFSPRYVAHMIAEQTMPSVAGYFAGMLYNPNNVTREAAPVTVRLELEAAGMIARMVGFDPEAGWAHLTSGGTVANIEALWVARTVRYLPMLMVDVLEELDLDHELRRSAPATLMKLSPDQSFRLFSEVFRLADERFGDDSTARVLEAYRRSNFNVTEQGIGAITARLDSDPVILYPETYHYSLPKVLDILGLGRRAQVTVPVDARFRMDPRALAGLLDEIDADGRHVLAVVTVAGSTEEGAIDPVHEVVRLREAREKAGRPSFWLHVDAAYGGYLRTLTIPERLGLGKSTGIFEVGDRRIELPLHLPYEGAFDALEALGRADSLTVDPHKLGYIPYPAGAICFRSDLVRPILRQDAPYIEEGVSGPEDERSGERIGVYILEGSKPGAAAASVWLSHSTIPLDATGHGRLIRDTIRNTCRLHALLEHWSAIDPQTTVRAVALCPPDSNILCYALRPTEEKPGLAVINALNRELYERFSISSKRGRKVFEQSFFVSRTVITADHYRPETVADFLERLGVSAEEYAEHGVLLLRSTLMNPWLVSARKRGRDYLVEFVSELVECATKILAAPGRDHERTARSTKRPSST